MEQNKVATRQQVIETLQKTSPLLIPDLDFVREKYISNFNKCNPDQSGELAYERNCVHFKQIISASDQLKNCDPFSFYAVFVTAAANGYSLDPADDEVYIVPRAGKAVIDRQAGAHVRRLKRTRQVLYFEPAKLIYKGDHPVIRNGRVDFHEERFESDEIVGGYVKAVLPGGKDIFFIYRKSDWEAWRKKSPNPKTYMATKRDGSQYLKESLWDGGVINGTQPDPGFLKTKIVKHAAKEKCWAPGMAAFSNEVEQYHDVEIDTDDEPITETQQQLPEPSGTYAPTMIVTPVGDPHLAGEQAVRRAAAQAATNPHHFSPEPVAPATVHVEDDNDIF